MQKVIKFRGQILDGHRKGEWVYGSLVTEKYKDSVTYAIITDTSFEEPSDLWCDGDVELNATAFIVDPETIGQYIGVNDKTDTEMYHGDICRDMFGDIGTIEIHQSMPTWTVLRYPDRVSSIQPYSFNNLTQLDEIIGNIHDNKNLFTQ